MSYVEEIDNLFARLERLRAAETRVLDGLAREAHEARQALYACEAERDEARAALDRAPRGRTGQGDVVVIRRVGYAVVGLATGLSNLGRRRQVWCCTGHGAVSTTVKRPTT